MKEVLWIVDSLVLPLPLPVKRTITNYTIQDAKSPTPSSPNEQSVAKATLEWKKDSNRPRQIVGNDGRYELADAPDNDEYDDYVVVNDAIHEDWVSISRRTPKFG